MADGQIRLLNSWGLILVEGGRHTKAETRPASGVKESKAVKEKEVSPRS